TLGQYLDYTKAKVVGYVPDWAKLHEVWSDADKREAFIQALEAASVYVEVLAEVLAQPRADQFDLLAHIAFAKPIHTRHERAEAFVNREQRFIESHHNRAHQDILSLLDMYPLTVVTELSYPAVFGFASFHEMD